MWNARLDEAQAGIKIAERTIDNLRYTDDTTFMAEGEEELHSLLMKVKKESEKTGLKFNIQKKDENGIWSHPFMAKKKKMEEKSMQWQSLFSSLILFSDFCFFLLFWGSKITANSDCSHDWVTELTDWPY